jgi:DNA-binding MarR family transcriptional regulator
METRGPIDASSDERCAAFASDPRIVLTGNLMAAAHRLTRQLDSGLEESAGISLAFYETMVRIRRSPAGRLTMGELATQIALSTGGVTRLIDRLEDDGFVVRVLCPSDRRATFLELTKAGIACLETATETYLTLLDDLVVSRLAASDFAIVDRSLATLADER